jgi:beta-lactamase superfamily II metal-dependent hydrolase
MINRARIRTLIALALAGLLFVPGGALCHSNYLEVHFINVVNGESILLREPGGGSVLFDAGGMESGFFVADYLKKNGIDALDCLIFTNQKDDRIGGALFLMENIAVKRLYDNGYPVRDTKLARSYSQVVREKGSYSRLNRGDEISVGEMDLKVIWPPKSRIFADDSNNSVVSLIEFGRSRCLLTGGVDSRVEAELLENNDDLRAGILKIGLHGYQEASSMDFLIAVSPEVGIVYPRRGAIEGSPADSVLRRLFLVGARTCRVGGEKPIVISADMDGRYFFGRVD